MLLLGIITHISAPVLCNENKEQSKITLNDNDQKIYDALMQLIDKYPMLKSILVVLNEESIANENIMKSVIYFVRTLAKLIDEENKEFFMILATSMLNVLRQYQNINVGLIKWEIENKYINKDKNISEKILKEYPFSFKVKVYSFKNTEANRKGLRLKEKLTTEQQNAAIRKYIDSLEQDIKVKSYKHDDEYESMSMYEYIKNKLKKNISNSTLLIDDQFSSFEVFEIYNIKKIKAEDISDMQKHRFISANTECTKEIEKAINKMQEEKDDFIKTYCSVNDTKKFAQKLYTKIKSIA